MWPYKMRNARDTGDVREKSPSKLAEHNFRRNDTWVRIWLPEKLVQGIDLMCLNYDSSRPDILRWIFFEHAFGRIELAHLALAEADRKAKPVEPGQSQIKFSAGGPWDHEKITRRSVMHRFLGKSDLSIKLFLPMVLGQQLQDLANAEDKALSDYLRGVLVKHLYGERFFQEWQSELQEATRWAIEHEQEPPPFKTKVRQSK